MLPTIRFTLGGGGGGGNYVSSRAKRRIRKVQTTAYQQKIAALRKQLDQDVPVTCWSDRIREEPDGTLAVSFGSGISKPRTISSIASFNMKFLRAYWREEDVDPDAFHTTLMTTVLPKKGDLSDPNKWMGISLLSVASKLVSSVLATRLGNHFIEVGLDEQC